MNSLILISDGSEYFDRVISAIRSSKKEIFVETYIFSSDEVGKRIATELIEAARRGVYVCVLVDGVGSRSIDSSFIDWIKRNGVDFRFFRPMGDFYRLGSLVFSRLHRKIISIDGDLAFVGGMNIHCDQLNEFDFVAQISGPLANRVHFYVRLFSLRFRKRWSLFFQALKQRKLLKAGSYSAQFLVRDNFLHRREIEHAYIREIEHSRGEVLIANAYFAPMPRLNRALKRAVKRGVKVTLLLQGVTDHLIIKWATRLLYKNLIRNGIEVYEYRKSLLHAKVAVIDRSWFTVGSANLDLFSLVLSLEANIAGQSIDMSHSLREKLLLEIKEGSEKIHLSHVAQFPLTGYLLGGFGWVVLKLIELIAFMDRDRSKTPEPKD